MVCWTALGLASVIGPLALPGTAIAGKPDLAQKSVSDPPVQLAAGASLVVSDRVRNRGTSVAARSRTRYYLSVDAKHGPSDTRLRGKRSVPRLLPGRDSAGSKKVRLPVTTPLGRFRLVACADDLGDVRERRRRNNCRASAARVRVSLPATCHARLRRLGISYSNGPRLRGVADPVSIGLPINGIDYYAVGEPRPQKTLFMDCTLALALHRLAETLRPHEITSVQHFGIYEYRCIGGTSPCVLSQHAHATAIDLHEFRTSDGKTYNVESDWIIDPDEEPTCSAPTLGFSDMLLHELACEWHQTELFNTILTPNYNADHRNHFHVDLTPGSHFIG